MLIFGDLTAQCANCQAIDLKLDVRQCPECATAFRYISFRNIKQHLPKLQHLSESRPELIFIDYDDFKRLWGSLRAEEFLK